MTREEAIAILQEEIDGNLELTLSEWRERDEQKLFPAIRMAIEALSADAVTFETQVESTRQVLDDFARDRVKVVRCKDCKWHKLTDNNETEVCTNKQWDISMAVYPIISADDFCSYGERREP